MRRGIVLVLAMSLLVTMLGGPAAAGSSNGCAGVENALDKVSDKGKRALEVVAVKLGCEGVVEEPPPVDPLTCPDELTVLATYAYAGTLSTDSELTDPQLDPFGYPYWIDSPGWFLEEDSPAHVIQPPGAKDGYGFYWTALDGVTVETIVLKSREGTVISHEAADPVNLNWFRDPDTGVLSDTGLSRVRFCGSLS